MDNYCERAHQESIRNRLRSRDNGFTAFELTGNETISGLFSEQARRTPDKQAVVSGDSVLSYEELDQLSCDIDFLLRQLRQWHPAPTAILLAQHTNFLASVLAVLKSGGFYVPLDPAFPEIRNAQILRQAKSPIILTERRHQQLAERLASPEQVLVYIDDVERGRGRLSDDSEPDGLACIIFTSGSTGRPKGVMQTHRNVLQIVRRYTNNLYLGSLDRVSLLASCSVTASLAPLLSPVLNGATVCAFSVLEQGLAPLPDWLNAQGITIYDSAPSLFRHLMRSVSMERQFSSVQIVRLVSDSMYKGDWRLFEQHFPPDSVLVNNYGCSEMSTVAGFYMDRDSRLDDSIVPVGYPLEGVEISILHDDRTSTPVSSIMDFAHSPIATGEIVLRSRYLSPGYWNDAAATNAAFAAAESNSGARVYRTGDLGAVRNDQGLVHLGRADLQVKLSGFRVEISEVEACMRGYPGVRESALVVHTPEHGERELIGFVVMDSEAAQNGSDVRSYVQGRLPAHMVPTEIMAVVEIPCTPNGKIDRSALIVLREEARKRKSRRAPRTDTEEVLSEIWKQLLRVDQVGVEDDFFELDGNSLLGMRMLSCIVDTYGLRLSVRTIFQYPTIRQMAELVDRMLTDIKPLESSQP